ncbi:hypothetical protein ACQP2T_07040 [Nonomuraea sp. CA-143628]|uniref:hypothetical protein n=1 Tax=Nonomuraea sp. CA-143628 TaxID=3239997 RepID=UPI003D8EFDD2
MACPVGRVASEGAITILGRNFDARRDMVFIGAEAPEMTWEDAREEPFDPGRATVEQQLYGACWG